MPKIKATKMSYSNRRCSTFWEWKAWLLSYQVCYLGPRVNWLISEREIMLYLYGNLTLVLVFYLQFGIRVLSRLKNLFWKKSRMNCLNLWLHKHFIYDVIHYTRVGPSLFTQLVQSRVLKRMTNKNLKKFYLVYYIINYAIIYWVCWRKLNQVVSCSLIKPRHNRLH